MFQKVLFYAVVLVFIAAIFTIFRMVEHSVTHHNYNSQANVVEIDVADPGKSDAKLDKN